ncbi:MAG: Ger(x)C family spore germination C-terminal domain-containing protein, partial [Oscillospiraceae bacterium]|nr:Ger(x)C family spore germination C-terminal domain-containing protein [Oscillospiraceae bacterium]
MQYFGGVNLIETHLPSTDISSNELDISYKPGETPISNQGGLETIGLAVFRGDRLVGELDSIETMSHLITVNKLESATISIPSPFSQTSTIALSINLESRTKNSVEFVNNFPFIRSHSNIS